MSLKQTCVGALAIAALVGCGTDPATMGGGAVGGTAGSGGIGGGGAGGVGGVGGVGGTAGSGGVGGGNPLQQRFPEVTDWDAFEIVYPQMYSGYDGVHTFKVPVRVRCTSGIPVSAWTAEPASAVTFDADPDNANGAMITVVAPVANITIAVVSGTRAGTAPLTVTIGTPAQWELGNQRYNTGSDWMLDLAMPELPPPDTKCTVCHSANSSAGFDIEHTPTQMARASDTAITQIMTTGTKPADVPFRVLPESFTYTDVSVIPFVERTLYRDELYAEFHKWEATPDQLTGMLLYLRALPPRGQGCVTDPSDGMCKDVEADPDAECTTM